MTGWQSPVICVGFRTIGEDLGWFYRSNLDLLDLKETQHLMRSESSWLRRDIPLEARSHPGVLNPDLPDVWNDMSVTLNIGHEMALSKTPRSPCTKNGLLERLFHASTSGRDSWRPSQKGLAHPINFPDASRACKLSADGEHFTRTCLDCIYNRYSIT